MRKRQTKKFKDSCVADDGRFLVLVCCHFVAASAVRQPLSGHKFRHRAV